MDEVKKQKIEGRTTYFELLPGPNVNTILTMNLLDKMDTLEKKVNEIDINILRTDIDGIHEKFEDIGIEMRAMERALIRIEGYLCGGKEETQKSFAFPNGEVMRHLM